MEMQYPPMRPPKYVGEKALLHQSSLWAFPQDEFIHPADYGQAMHNSYMTTAPAFIAGLEYAGYRLSPESQERSLRTMTLAHWLDHFLDSAPNKHEAYRSLDDMVSYYLVGNDKEPAVPDWYASYAHNLRTASHLFRNSLVSMEDDKREPMVAALMAVAYMGRSKAEPRDVRQYIRVLKDEANQFALGRWYAIEADLPDEDKYAVLAWMEAVTNVVILSDSAVDLKADFQEGLTKVAPTIGHRALIAANVMAYLPSVFNTTGRPILRGIREWSRVKKLKMDKG